MSRVWSDEPSSETMTSSEGESWGNTDRSCSRINFSPLYVAIQTETIFTCRLSKSPNTSEEFHCRGVEWFMESALSIITNVRGGRFMTFFNHKIQSWCKVGHKNQRSATPPSFIKKFNPEEFGYAKLDKENKICNSL